MNVIETCQSLEKRRPDWFRVALLVQSTATALLLVLFRAHALFVDYSASYFCAVLIGLAVLLVFSRERGLLSAYGRQICAVYVLELPAVGLLVRGFHASSLSAIVVPLIGGALYAGGDWLARRRGKTALVDGGWISLLVKTAGAFCLAVLAAGLDRTVGNDKVSPTLSLTFYLTWLIAGVLLFMARPRHTAIFRSHGIRFWSFTVTMAIGMTCAVSAYFRPPMEAFFTAYDVKGYSHLTHDITFICTFAAFFLLFFIGCHLALPFIRRFILRTDRFEKRYLLITLLAYGAVIGLLTFTTNAFSYPNNDVFTYDNIFTSDTRLLNQGYWNVFSNVNSAENDIRQMLFGVIGLPVSVFAYLFAFAANLLNVAAGSPFAYWHLFGIGLMLCQAVMMAFVGVMLRRILRSMVSDVYAKLFTVIYALSYSTIIFTFLVEQYVLGLFTLVFTVYTLTCDYSDRKAAVGIAFSTGTMTPSAATGGMLLLRGGPFDWKSFLKAALCSIGLFLFLTVSFGQITQLLNAPEYLKGMVGGFGGTKLSMSNKITQFVEAASNMVFPPELTTVPAYNDVTGIRLVPGRMIDQVLGCIVLGLTVAGAVVTLKKPAGRMAGFWFLVSVGVLVVVGWGAKENGMMLYTSYFYWAFLLLIAGIFDALFARAQKAGGIVLTVAAVLLGGVNLYGFWQMFRMACAYYPAHL